MKLPKPKPEQLQWLLLLGEIAMTAFSLKKGGVQIPIPTDLDDAVKKVLESVNSFLKAKETGRNDDIKFDGILSKHLTLGERGVIEDFIKFLADPTRKLDQRFRFNCMVLIELTDEATLIVRIKELAAMATDDQRLYSCQQRGLLQGDADPLAALKKGVPAAFKQSLDALTAAYPAWEAQWESDINASGIPNAITDANMELDGWVAKLIDGIRTNLKK